MSIAVYLLAFVALVLLSTAPEITPPIRAVLVGIILVLVGAYRSATMWAEFWEGLVRKK